MILTENTLRFPAHLVPDRRWDVGTPLPHVVGDYARRLRLSPDGKFLQAPEGERSVFVRLNGSFTECPFLFPSYQIPVGDFAAGAFVLVPYDGPLRAAFAALGEAIADGDSQMQVGLVGRVEHLVKTTLSAHSWENTTGFSAFARNGRGESVYGELVLASVNHDGDRNFWELPSGEVYPLELPDHPGLMPETAIDFRLQQRKLAARFFSHARHGTGAGRDWIREHRAQNRFFTVDVASNDPQQSGVWVVEHSLDGLRILLARWLGAGLYMDHGEATIAFPSEQEKKSFDAALAQFGGQTVALGLLTQEDEIVNLVQAQLPNGETLVRGSLAIQLINEYRRHDPDLEQITDIIYSVDTEAADYWVKVAERLYGIELPRRGDTSARKAYEAHARATKRQEREIAEHVARLTGTFPLSPVPPHRFAAWDMPFRTVRYEHFPVSPDRMLEWLPVETGLSPELLENQQIVQLADTADNKFLMRVMAIDRENSRIEVAGVFNPAPSQQRIDSIHFFVGSLNLSDLPQVGAHLTLPEFAGSDRTDILAHACFLDRAELGKKVRELIDGLVNTHGEDWRQYVPVAYQPRLPILQPWRSPHPIKSISVSL